MIEVLAPYGFQPAAVGTPMLLSHYPTRGWRFWAFMAGIVAVGLFGVSLVLIVGGHD
jgi:hypothetical protein